MCQTKNEKNSYRAFILVSLTFCPIVVLAPLGSWIPLILCAIAISFFYKSFFIKDLTGDSLYIKLFLILFWITISTFFILKNIYFLEKVFSLFILIISGFILSKVQKKILNFNKIIFIFSISFISSASLLIIDFNLGLGLKLWLSQNLDFSNFKNFYQLKSWISFSDFQEKKKDIIITYLNTTYDRGVISLIILSVPLSLINYRLNYKFLSIIIFLLGLVLAFGSSVSVVKLSSLISAFFISLFLLKKNFFKKIFYITLFAYSITSPFILGILDYKNYSQYEKSLKSKQTEIHAKYCDTFYNFKTIIDCKEKIQGKIKTSIQSKEFYINYVENKYFMFSEHFLHRLMIWSYVKNKILERPILGHGAFSSSSLNQHQITTTFKTNYELLPLHPHNGVLQIWLELGFIGIIFFLIFISSIFSKIYKYADKDKVLTAASFFSFIQIFLIGQISFGIWQTWWISVIFLNCVLFSFLFKKH